MTGAQRAVVVTGAARGIGRAIAERLISDGAHAIMVDRDESVARVVAELPSGRATPVVNDLIDAAGSQAAIRAAIAARPEPLTGLVNNAGVTRDALIEEMSEQDFVEVMRINLGATYQLTTALCQLMPAKGAVVSLSSRSYLGSMGQVNYAASKGGVVGMTRALAIGLAPRLRVNAVAPGLVDTEMVAAMPQPVRTKIVAAIPLERLGQPTEVASIVAWLLSDEAAYVTGQCVLVCGGRSIA
jgi:NAD(P)-dependent dehydrogenase (short-subunit alcohol dehydrogenase family)